MAIYLLLLPESFWIKLSHLFKANKKSYKFYYDAECPLCIKTVTLIRHIDFLKKIDCITIQGNAMEDGALKKYSENELLINIHGVNKKGKVFVGYDAYIELLKKLMYTYPIALLMMLPGLSLLGKKIYAFIAGNRINERCTEETCFIPVYTDPPFETDDYLISGWNQLSMSKFIWKCMFYFFIIAQILVIWASPLVQRRTSMLQSVNRFVLSGYYNTKYIFKRYFGVTNHTVFLNDHFDKNNRIFKVTCLYNNKEITLPIIRNNGMSGCYNIGPLWCYYTFFTAFDVTKQQSNYYTFEERVIPFLKYFGKENNINLSDVCFNIYIKEIEIPKKWEKDFLHIQMDKPWKLTGTCKMENNKFLFHWLNFK
jgi:predicted DCC family thiol-disulfide oxidoreductase YuxK